MAGFADDTGSEACSERTVSAATLAYDRELRALLLLFCLRAAKAAAFPADRLKPCVLSTLLQMQTQLDAVAMVIQRVIVYETSRSKQGQ